ncbi:MAG TPA: PLP-dependent aminotransferase family protein, partial [Terriglobales bacterium]|nr:PLP-dependent aminotransferase family protein [Terriglobales bacterium]
HVAPVQSGEMGLDPAAVERAIKDCSKWGRPRAIYDIPDFNNPLGTYMPLDRRRRLLDLCRHHGMLLIEDNPYGMFLYEGEKLPTLKALDREHVVLYIGSFAKTLFPGLRLGYLVADQKLTNNQFLAQELSKVKSLLTVNTPPLLQAIVAEILVRNQCSLKAIIAPKAAGYRRNRDVMIDSLATNFSDMQDLVCWNSPRGGFFLTVNLPFPFGVAELQRCAAEYGVIVGPMQFFALAPGSESRIRLSFSYVDENGIRTGIRQLACFVREQCKVHEIRN